MRLNEIKTFSLVLGIPLAIILSIIFGINWFYDTFDEDTWRDNYYKAEEELYNCEAFHAKKNIPMRHKGVSYSADPDDYTYAICEDYENTAKKYYKKLYHEEYEYDWRSEDEENEAE